MSMIQLKHLGRFYPLEKGKFFYVLRDINLEVNDGDFVSIKSTSTIMSSPTSPSLGWHVPRSLRGSNPMMTLLLIRR
jgi:hypothetical protein